MKRKVWIGEPLQHLLLKLALVLSHGVIVLTHCSRYWAFKNAYSMDGLPGMKRGFEVGKREKVAPMKKMVGPLAPKNGTTHQDGFTLEQVVVIFIVAFIAGMMAVSLSPEVLRNAMVALRSQGKETVWLPRSLR